MDEKADESRDMTLREIRFVFAYIREIDPVLWEQAREAYRISVLIGRLHAGD